jgi:hypothetical protein
MSETYQPPKSAFASLATKPSRKLVDITFWMANLVWIIFLILVLAPSQYSEDGKIKMIFLLAGLISLVIYFVAIGWYAQKRGRSALVWGGGAFIASLFLFLISTWISYIASFHINTKKCPYCMEFIKEEATKCPHCSSVV